MRTKLLLAGLALTPLLAASCGDDDDATGSTSTSTAVPMAEVVEVTAVDFSFKGLPDEVEAGTTLTLHNDSDREVHELVGWLLPADEKRSAEDLLALPEEEIGALLAGPPTIGLVALPGEDGQTVSGDTLTEPGRYLVFCAIPTGATADDVLAAMGEAQESDGPPEIPGGPPHLTHGMFTEVEVR